MEQIYTLKEKSWQVLNQWSKEELIDYIIDGMNEFDLRHFVEYHEDEISDTVTI